MRKPTPEELHIIGAERYIPVPYTFIPLPSGEFAVTVSYGNLHQGTYQIISPDEISDFLIESFAKQKRINENRLEHERLVAVERNAKETAIAGLGDIEGFEL